MKFLATFLLLIIPSLALSQNFVGGNQSGVWDSANSPYLVIDDIIVPADQMAARSIWLTLRPTL